MKRVLLAGSAAIVLLASPLVLELATGREEFEAVTFGIDILELLIFAGTIAVVALLTMDMRDFRRDRASMVKDLNSLQAENARWRETSRSQIEGFRGAVQKQFEDWGLTPAECDIASLVLKGCSHKQIAELRNSTVTTVRQQAQAIYRKSGLHNRSELSAFFLDSISDPDDNLREMGPPPQSPKLGAAS